MLAAAVTAALVVVAGCGRDRPDPAPDLGAAAASPMPSLTVDFPGLGSWSVAGVDDTDPEAVLVAVAATVYSYAPAVDATAGAAFDRARPLLAERYQRQVGVSATGLARFTGADWRRWAQRGAVVAASAAVTGDEHPSDTAVRHGRVVLVTQSVHPSPSGDGGPGTEIEARPAPIVLYMIAERADPAARWRITMIAPR